MLPPPTTRRFIINYSDGNGWKILSSDIRTPAVLAESDTGSFSMNDDDSGIAVWLDIMSTNMNNISKSPDKDLAFTNEEILSNRSVWTGERIILDPIIVEDGHWEDEIISSSIEVLDTIDHFVAKWHQGVPYNQYCPLKTDGSGNRMPAGCVSVAGSEVLFYLHEKFGHPHTMFTSMSESGDTLIFSNPNSTVWALMNKECQFVPYSNLPEALMIRYVGARILTDYHNTFSWALPAALRTLLFNAEGYNCTSDDYNETIVMNSLINMLPVIITASDQLIPINGRIHSFVIDGYRTKRTKYYHHYYWVWDNPEAAHNHLTPVDYYGYTYSSLRIDILINWGWKSEWESPGINNGFYSLSSGWEVTNGSTYDYNYNVVMLYGFDYQE